MYFCDMTMQQLLLDFVVFVPTTALICPKLQYFTFKNVNLYSFDFPPLHIVFLCFRLVELPTHARKVYLTLSLSETPEDYELFYQA